MEFKILETPVAYLIRDITKKIDSIFLPICEEKNLTVMKLKVLTEISKEKEVTIGAIGNALGVAGGNISNMCKNLESEGYLKRTRSEKDERVVNVTLTKKGNEVLADIDNMLLERYQRYNTEVDDKDYDMILQGLTKLNKILDYIYV